MTYRECKRVGVQENFRRLKLALGFFVINYGLKPVAWIVCVNNYRLKPVAWEGNFLTSEHTRDLPNQSPVAIR